MFIFDYQMFEHQLIDLVKNVSFMKSNDIKNMQILKLNNIIDYMILFIFIFPVIKDESFNKFFCFHCL